ncbi:glycosyltransferase family 2 protein [Amphibacillus sp. Q70]|uniref:glycosyltransferase family 2 protein n=1 Tax=Amphibacillus sp. Q70 TaxID=3453416 RepID=UPI003F879C17
MKLLSVVIPCYNSQDYMEYCIESLLPGGEDVELLIVNDGSSDNTAKIADKYAIRYPSIVRVVHQKNGGHGEAVNAGIRNASGFYLKVVDSDDWVDVRAYLKIIKILKKFVTEKQTVDMLISNFTYEKEDKKYKKVMKYENVLPVDKIFTWEDIKPFRRGQYLLMHSLIYRTELLKNCGLVLPKHTFYVDNLFVFVPLKHVKTMYYINLEFYRYFIGREDQSVHESVMIKRIDQQIKVNKQMIDDLELENITSPKLRQYLLHQLEIVTVVSSILLIKSGTTENLQKKKELWKYMREKDQELYREIRYGMIGILLNLPGRFGRSISVGGYKISQRFIGFN